MKDRPVMVTQTGASHLGGAPVWGRARQTSFQDLPGAVTGVCKARRDRGVGWGLRPHEEVVGEGQRPGQGSRNAPAAGEQGGCRGDGAKGESVRRGLW